MKQPFVYSTAASSFLTFYHLRSIILNIYNKYKINCLLFTQIIYDQSFFNVDNIYPITTTVLSAEWMQVQLHTLPVPDLPDL